MEFFRDKISIDQLGETATVITFMDPRILGQMYIYQLEGSIMSGVEKSTGKLILDFSNVTFMSSAVFGLLIKIRKLTTEASRDLELSHISPKLLEGFKILHLEKLFTIL